MNVFQQKKNSSQTVIIGMIVLVALLIGSFIYASAQGAGFTNGVLQVRLNEWSLGFDKVTVKKADLQTETAIGSELPIHVVNNGSFGHNFAIKIESNGREYYIRTRNLQPGEETTFVVSLPVGSYELLCSINGHAGRGMEGTLVIGEGENKEEADEENGSYDY